MKNEAKEYVYFAAKKKFLNKFMKVHMLKKLCLGLALWLTRLILHLRHQHPGF